MISLTRGTWNGQIHRHRKYSGGCQEPGRGENRGLLVKGYRVSVCKRKTSWGRMAVKVAQQCESTSATEPYASKWLRWYILSSLYVTAIKKKKRELLKSTSLRRARRSQEVCYRPPQMIRSSLCSPLSAGPLPAPPSFSHRAP